MYVRSGIPGEPYPHSEFEAYSIRLDLVHETGSRDELGGIVVCLYIYVKIAI